VVQLLRRVATVEGRALLNGRNLFELDGEPLAAARKDIQIIFQDPFASLNPRLRVFEILEEGMKALRPDMDACARRTSIARLCDRVGLRAEALERYPHEFSGGQRQRIAIARALAVEPKLIVCDEPTSALDVSVQAQILNLLRELQSGLGLSYVFITHNMGVVEYIADHVAVMQQGRIVEQGLAADVLDTPSSEYTRHLLSSVPRLTSCGLSSLAEDRLQELDHPLVELDVVLVHAKAVAFTLADVVVLDRIACRFQRLGHPLGLFGRRAGVFFTHVHEHRHLDLVSVVDRGDFLDDGILQVFGAHDPEPVGSR
jgi:ABC-type dipeptide/oligopeptide/nickel transport system ATPase subunit